MVKIILLCLIADGGNFSGKTEDCKFKLRAEVIDCVKNSANYTAFGGDLYFETIAVLDTTDRVVYPEDHQ